MILDRIRNMLSTMNNPEATKEEGGMVCRIWEDLEVTMTKCGSLLGQRNEHMIERASLTVPLPREAFPNQTETHAFIWVAYNDYKTCLDSIRDALK